MSGMLVSGTGTRNKKQQRKGFLSQDASASSKNVLLKVSIAVNVLFVVSWLCSTASKHPEISKLLQRGAGDSSMWIRGYERVWHGGHPHSTDHRGSCWCAAHGFCLCTPSVAIDLIMVSEEGDDTFIWVVQRKDTNQMATMGGFVDVGESVEQAVHRELKEEMGIVLEQGSGSEQLKLQGVYSDPRRDNRRRNASVVFVVKLAHTIHPKAADDAKAVKKIHVDEIEQYDFFADHKTILLDFRHSLKTSNHGLATTNSIGSGLTGEQLQSAQSAVAMERSICM